MILCVQVVRTGKTHCQPYTEAKYLAKKPLKIIHSDVFGQVMQQSINGLRYRLTFIDNYSKYMWVYLIKEKSEALQKFKEFQNKVKGDLDEKIWYLCIGNGGEYTSNDFSAYLNEADIRRQLTYPYT